jgi:hypothetical protein
MDGSKIRYQIGVLKVIISGLYVGLWYGKRRGGENKDQGKISQTQYISNK